MNLIFGKLADIRQAYACSCAANLVYPFEYGQSVDAVYDLEREYLTSSSEQSGFAF